MRLKNSEREALLKETHDKYERLVWFARSRPENYSVAEKGLKLTEFLHPEEVAELKGDECDFHHGFNSGVLAAVRLMMTAADEGVEAAKAQFPELDT